MCDRQKNPAVPESDWLATFRIDTDRNNSTTHKEKGRVSQKQYKALQCGATAFDERSTLKKILGQVEDYIDFYSFQMLPGFYPAILPE
jgi:hypothetical protein